MRLVCLNIWGGHEYEPLMKYLLAQSGTTDIFCFQEVFTGPEGTALGGDIRTNILGDLERSLPDFEPLFYPCSEIRDRGRLLPFGVAIFVRKNHAVVSREELFASGAYQEITWHEPSPTLGFAGCATVRANGRLYTFMNVHGIAVWPKFDTPARLAQSRSLRAHFDGAPGIKFLCGDFNLFPDTESVAILARGIRNLTAEFGIAKTRSAIHYAKSLPSHDLTDTVSDYCFVSPDVQVRSFCVPGIAVSDHLPLEVEFD
jgi:endonuclease/exonuclease/phosphatase family metal-dependent hydrolase